MSIDNIRLSEKEKQQLITLKRRTGLENWNSLCRWAFCLSIKEPSKPPSEVLPADSSVNMDWKTFGGSNRHLYLALLRQRARQDDISVDEPAKELSYFRLHLHRGISYLIAETERAGVAEMLRTIQAKSTPSAIST